MKLFRRLAVSAYRRERLVLAATMAKWPYLLALPGSLWFFIAASSWQEQARFGVAAFIALCYLAMEIYYLHREYLRRTALRERRRQMRLLVARPPNGFARPSEIRPRHKQDVQ